jgi:uncharacterized protein (DUF433 family)
MAIQYETPEQLRDALTMELYRLKDAHKLQAESLPKLASALADALFEAENPTLNAIKREENYRYLEPKPYKQTKQLGIKGRNMIVWNLVATMRTEEFGIKEIASDYRLPVEAVIEALDYYYKNRSMIEAENEQIGRELGLIKD